MAALALAALSYLYASAVGAVGLWPDTLYAASQAKHLLETGQIGIGQGMPAEILPLYGLFMLIPFGLGDLLKGHQILIGVQCVLYALALLPLRQLLLRGADLKLLTGLLLAFVVMLTPAFLAYSSMLAADILVTALVIWLAYYLDHWLTQGGLRPAIITSVFLALLLLTHTSAIAIWFALLICLLLKRNKNTKEYAIVIFLPLLVYAAWFFGVAMRQGAEAPLVLNFNNALARFNLLKNGFIYLIYAGAPLAGIAMLVACLMRGHKLLQNTFLLFCLLSTFFVLALCVFTAPVIVEAKLDYFTGRALDPFLILSFLFFMRLDDKLRCEVLGNALLIFVALLFFSFPHALQHDIPSALSFWAQGTQQAGIGMVRNVIFLLLLGLPVLLLYWKPRFFIATYIFTALVIGAGSTAQNHAVWSRNEDGNMRFVSVNALSNLPDFQGKTIFSDYDCRKKAEQDIAHIYRCFDVGRALYFLPKNPKLTTTEEALRQNTEQAVFVATENDNLLGPTIAQIGLARFMRLEVTEKLKSTPLISIEKIDGLKRYHNIPVDGKLERMAFLDGEANIALRSNKNGCVVFEAVLTSVSKDLNVTAEMNGKTLRRVDVPLLKPPAQPILLSFKLQLFEGLSTLKIKTVFKKEEGETSELLPQLVLYNRPIIKSCD